MDGRNRTHVSHCVWRCAHPEAADSGNFDGSIVIAAHGVEYDKVGEQGHEDNLSHSDDRERTGDIEKFPDTQAHQGHGQEDVEANITHGLDFRNWHVKAGGMVSRIAKNSRYQHGADIEREHKANAFKEGSDIGTNTHAEQDFARSQHEFSGTMGTTAADSTSEA